MMVEFIVTTYNQQGQESKRTKDLPFVVKGETILEAAETIDGGTVLTEARHFVLVGKVIGKQVLRYVVTPIRCQCSK